MIYLDLLWAGIFKVSFGVKSGSRLAVKVGDGATYWRAFLVLWEWLKN